MLGNFPLATEAIAGPGDPFTAQYTMKAALRLSSRTVTRALIAYSSELELTWNFEDCIKRFFRVEGKCTTPPECTTLTPAQEATCGRTEFPLASLFSTGLDDDRIELPVDADDLHWTTPSGMPAQHPMVIDDLDLPDYAIGSDENAQWVGYNNVDLIEVVFRVQFDMPVNAAPATFEVDVDVSVLTRVVGIFVNGVDTGLTVIYDGLSPEPLGVMNRLLTIKGSAFQAGLNSIDFKVRSQTEPRLMALRVAVLKTRACLGNGGFPPSSGNCERWVIVNVMACNAEEVCRILRERQFVFTIDTIRQVPENSLNLNCFPDVTPTIENCIECCDFLVDENLTDTWGAESYEYPLHTYAMQARLSLLSNTTATNAQRRSMTGVLRISSATQVRVVVRYAMNAAIQLFSRTGVSASGSRYRMRASLSLSSSTGHSRVLPYFRYQGGIHLVLRKRPALVVSRSMNAVLSLSSAFAHRIAFRRGMNAKIVLGSEAFIAASSFRLPMNAVLRLGSATLMDASDQEVEVDIVSEEAVLNEGVIFGSDPASVTLSEVIPMRTDAACCVTPMPTRLQLRHNLRSIKQFRYFIARNSLLVPGDITDGSTATFLPLYYSERVGAYVGQLHYTGLPVGAGVRESWSASFEFACNGTANPSQFWKFTMLLKAFYQDRVAAVRLVAGFAPTEVCKLPVFNSFSFAFDSERGVSAPDAGLGLVFHDEEDMLSSSLADGILKFSLSASPNLNAAQTFPHSLDEQLRATRPPLL